MAAQSTEKPKKTAVPDSSDANTEEPAKTPGATPSKTPSATYEPILSDKKVKTYPSVGVVVAGDSAYEMYNYVDSVVSQYAKVLNAFRKKLDAKVKIFDIVAPTSAGNPGILFFDVVLSLFHATVPACSSNWFKALFQ